MTENATVLLFELPGGGWAKRLGSVGVDFEVVSDEGALEQRQSEQVGACLVALDAGDAILALASLAAAEFEARLIVLLPKSPRDLRGLFDQAIALGAGDVIHWRASDEELILRLQLAEVGPTRRRAKPAKPEPAMPAGVDRRARDHLTGLATWAQIKDRLDETLLDALHSRAAQPLVGLVILNLDRFKRITASYSRERADAILLELSGRMTRVLKSAIASGMPVPVQATSLIGRMPGDEFVFLLVGLKRVRDSAWFAREVLETLGDAFKIGDEPVFLSASIGISIAPLDAEDGEALLANAHSALDHAKEQGPGNFQFFSAERAATALRRLEMENRLRRAIEDDELALHYQPQVSLPSGAIHGVEALIRWQHPALGPVPPETFMEIAGEAGLLPEIGDWVLRRSLNDVAEWAGRGIAPIHVSVNVSADLMRRGHVTEMALDALAESGVDAGLLTLELTESVILEDLDAAIEAMGLLRGYGIRFALDDFGTGYSALSYLKALPFDCLKVDRSFVQDIETSAEAGAVIRAIIGMAKTLNMTVAAEGVESEGQLERLIEEGCDLYQGFLCSEPLPADGLLDFLKEWPERQRLHHAD